MVCLICEVNPEKYKCPVCRLSYCSVVCWKKHKEGEPCQPSEVKDAKSEKTSTFENYTNKSFQYPTEHTIPKEKLERLGSSRELNTVLANPHLRAMMTAINSSPDPAASIRAAMMEPIFVEFSDIALKTVDL